MNGVLVWSLTLIITLPLLVAGSGRTLGRAIKIHDEGLRISRQAVAVAEEDLAKTAAKRSQDQLGSFVEEAVQSIPTNAAPKADTRAEREVGFAVTKLFAPGNAAAFQANRLEAINALMVYTEMSAADATTTVDAWITSHKNLQAELDKFKAEINNLKAVAEQKASADDDARSVQKAQHLSRVGRWSFFSLLIGLLGASLGGRCGAKCASQNANLRCAPGKPV
jgi:tRNA(Glu) U13 pseudouridine synthase TruD